MSKNPQDFIKFFQENDKLGSLFKAKIISISQEECLCEYEVSPLHFNPNGILHGGALFSVMDSSQGAFVHFVLDEKFKYAATGTATIKYLAPVFSGPVRIRTWLKEIQNRKIFVNSEATNDTGAQVAVLEEIWIAALK